MKSSTIWHYFQSLGKAFMYPIALLSVCGMMLGLGSGLSDASVAHYLPFMAWPPVKTTLLFIVELGLYAFANLPVLFAIAIPLGLLKDKEDKAYGAFSGLIGFMAMHLGTHFYLQQNNLLVASDQMSTHGQTIILGIQTYNTSVLGGIVSGLLVNALYRHIVALNIPASLGFYSGPRLVPIVTLILMSLVGLVIPFVWPPFFNMFMAIGRWISTSGPVGYFFYAVAERVTIPFGLNHLVTSVFRFTPIGGSAIINQQEYFGTLNMFMAYVKENAVIPLDLAGKMEQGKLMIQYGLAGAALAMYQTAKNRMAVKALLISGVLTVIVGGVSEPIEFLFLFVSPALFAFHAFMNGFANMILPYMGVKMGFTGDLIQFISFGVLRGVRTGWPIAIMVEVVYFVIYYLVFRWAILKFNLLTVGREEDGDSTLPDATPDKGEEMVSALGGRENIVSLDNCVTRLRLVVKDISLIDEARIKRAGGVAIVKLDATTLQIIIGTKVFAMRREMDAYMGVRHDGF
ncbi:PTS transporter subunit EIIC [Enterobacter sp. ENT03]|uniref:PTS transporter subunit EIIC n=1 Tax=Enterobacter sp. ENT03 TaxID=2854780 RepID=UPI001C438AC9|nr:PTS transporter subunit EIIC [Enterobacter sp. ENT03]MBV7407126.1 PTS transporter subunit EIIC [Enterobacter sp. ENT03]